VEGLQNIGNILLKREIDNDNKMSKFGACVDTTLSKYNLNINLFDGEHFNHWKKCRNFNDETVESHQTTNCLKSSRLSYQLFFHSIHIYKYDFKLEESSVPSDDL
jgi:hypothetical protein